MRHALGILLVALVCAAAHAESPVRTLVVGDVVVAEGIDWIAWDAPPESVELLQGVIIDGTQASPHRASGTVVLRLSKPTTIKLWSGADDPANPARTIVEWSPELEPSRIDELIGRIAAIESRLEQLAAGSLPQPPPPPEVLRVDPNTATLEELVRLPGIGPSLAQRIIEAREHVVFRTPMDLAIVKGIGAATVEGLAEFLVFEAPEEPEEEQDPAEGAEQEGEQTMTLPITSGLILHLDAQTIAGLSNSDPVAQWNDSSGNGNHAVQATGANQPTYVADGINGHPAIQFGGSHWLDAGVLPGFGNLSGADSRTQMQAGCVIFVVLKSSVTDAIISPVGNRTRDSSPGFGIVLNNFQFSSVAAGRIRANWRKSSGWGVAMRHDGDTGITNGEIRVLAVQIQLNSGVNGIWVDGNSYDLTYEDNDFSPFQSWSISPGLGIGADILGDGSTRHHFDGLIGEVLIYNSTLSDTDRQAVETYLAARWAEGGEPDRTISGIIGGTSSTISGSGSVMVSGAGSVTGAIGGVSGGAQVRVTGTSAIPGQTAAIAGTGNVIVTGSGAIDGQQAIILSNGSVIVGGSGALEGGEAIVVATGTVRVTASGDIPGQIAVIVGAGGEPLGHVIAQEGRLFYLPAQDRAFVLPRQSRAFRLPFQDRAFRLPGES